MKDIFYEGELSEAQIKEQLIGLRGHPYVPQSSFDVTTLLKVKIPGENKRVGYFAGVNVENREMELATCSEAGAISAMITALGPKAKIIEGWIIAAPRNAKSNEQLSTSCGVCRQRLTLYAEKNTKIHTIALTSNKKFTITVGDLIPHAFGYGDIEHMMLKMELNISHLRTDEIRNRLMRQGTILDNMQVFSWLKDIHSDNRACFANKTMVLRLNNGAYVAGASVDNPAYTASISAARSAVSIMNAIFGQQRILEVWYFEHNNIPAQGNRFYLLSGSSLQVLSEFCNNPNEVKVNIFNAKGNVKSWILGELIPHSPTFKHYYVEANETGKQSYTDMLNYKSSVESKGILSRL